MKQRCEWVGEDQLLMDYHDNEWGVPLHDDQSLFEFLILEGVQAGLSWLTILKKRKNYYLAFSGFDPSVVAQYNENKIQELLQNRGIIRNDMKIRAAITNARSFLKIQKEFGSFDKYIWQFVGNKPIHNRWKRHNEIPSKSVESGLMSRDLKKRGFKFVGPTICYAFMQAVGMVNDHTIDCFRHKELRIINTMRRKHCEITDPEKIKKTLSSVNIGRLATNGIHGYPYITPVNFVFYQGNIYFHCAPKGQKLDNIDRDPKVCFQVDIPLAYLDSGLAPGRAVSRLHQLYHCVIIRGEARIVPDGPLKVDALNALVAKHEKTFDFEKVHEDMPAYKACKVVEIIPKTMTAKSDLAQNRSDEERLAIAKYLKSRNWPKDMETVEAMGFNPKEI